MTPDATRPAAVPHPAPGRRYPSHPVVGVGGVVVAGDRVVLIRRRFDPMAGRWSIPGGAVELGETLQEALVRELREEIGLEVEVGPLVELFDRITRDEHGAVQYHYVLADFACVATGGTLTAASDVAEALLADPRDLETYDLTPRTLDVVRRGLQAAAALRPAASRTDTPADPAGR